MEYSVTPVQVIQSSVNMLVFTCFLEEAIREGTITPSTFKKELRFGKAQDLVSFKASWSPELLRNLSHNNTLMALGNTAIGTQKALEVLYGLPDAKDTTPAGSARVIVYQIRCAFAHDPLNPVWNPKPRFKHTYEVFLYPKGSPGSVARRMRLHPPSLLNKRLDPDDFGGIAAYIDLLRYFLAKAEDHPKGHQPYLPSIDKS